MMNLRAICAIGIAVCAMLALTWGGSLLFDRVKFRALKIEGERLYSEGDFAGAFEAVDAALSEEPQDLVVLAMRAGLARKLRKWAVAAADYRRIAEHSADPVVSYNLGYCLHMAGDCEEAVRTLDQLVAVVNSDADVFRVRGICQYRRGEWAAAHSDFRTAHRLHPSAMSAAGIGLCTFEGGDRDEAVKWLDEASKLDPTFPLAVELGRRLKGE